MSRRRRKLDKMAFDDDGRCRVCGRLPAPSLPLKVPPPRDQDVLDFALAAAYAVIGAAERVGLDESERQRVRQLSDAFAKLAERDDIPFENPPKRLSDLVALREDKKDRD